MTRLNSNINEPTTERTRITSGTNKQQYLSYKFKIKKISCTSIVPFPPKKSWTDEVRF